jgi:hypothetical protein
MLHLVSAVAEGVFGRKLGRRCSKLSHHSGIITDWMLKNQVAVLMEVTLVFHFSTQLRTDKTKLYLEIYYVPQVHMKNQNFLEMGLRWLYLRFGKLYFTYSEGIALISFEDIYPYRMWRSLELTCILLVLVLILKLYTSFSIFIKVTWYIMM